MKSTLSHRIGLTSLACLGTFVLACGSSDSSGLEPVSNVGETELAVDASSIDLIATGSLDGHQGDRAFLTSGKLENGVAGNLLGGIGSGIAHAGGDLFLALPDRGPNAVPFNTAVDDTVSYINRFQTVDLALRPSPRSASLPFTLSPMLLATTLLWTTDPLTYGSGTEAELGSGAPALNLPHVHFFTGRSDNFDASLSSTAPSNARLDPESIRVSNDGLRVYVSDEYGPHVYEFDRITGRRLRSFTLPGDFAIGSSSPMGDTEISGNTSGRVANKGMEGLALTPDGRTLVGMMQSPLIQDGGTAGRFTRIVTISLASGKIAEYAYELTNIGSAKKPKYPTVSDIVAVNGHEFLVDERDGAGLGDDSTATFKHVYQIDLTGAVDVSGITGEANLDGTAVPKTLFLDIVATLDAHGFASTDIPAKLEGLAFGRDVVLG
ncbi:MAG TPA: esterase-like activity of phytase family protein, partial [Polyangiaceae bacterium]|nr:esterase-like activity of phytase family protein [Polyangiaceae bacterium]